ncbi:MAG: hypothetical protein M1817_004161 [Caeruleum heppii]|nr:MAG: hypothetical protein M1817_004161 [Caeruleum heppii]
MPLPPLAPYPPSSLQKDRPPNEWDACLDAWASLIGFYLQSPRTEFLDCCTEKSSVSQFLFSYVHETSLSHHSVSRIQSPLGQRLHRLVFLLTHRVLSECPAIPDLLRQWVFLADLGVLYGRSQALQSLLASLWKRHATELEPGLQEAKKTLLRLLESASKAGPSSANNTKDVIHTLRHLLPLLRTSPDISAIFMIGSDFLDALNSAYSKASRELQDVLNRVAYVCLLSLTKTEKPNISLFIDHLFSLKTTPDHSNKGPKDSSSLAASLVCTTPFLTKIRSRLQGSDAARAELAISFLESLGNPPPLRRKKPSSRNLDKGKGPAETTTTDDEYPHGAFDDVHIHRMSLITQVQDIFPELGSGFVVKLLDEYNDDVEQVTAHLLEESLPAHLRDADRTEILPTPQNQTSHLFPRPTPPPSPPTAHLPIRRNIHDSTDLATLSTALPPSRLHRGRLNPDQTADSLLSDRTTAPSKAAILSALAVFNADDDERDDTYDVADVGGTVDTTTTGPADGPDPNLGADKNEEALFSAWKMSPEAFHRDSATRRGKARSALRGETGMTDEAIEGWAVMLGREPKRLRRLEAKYSTFGGGQRELAPTAWRGNTPGGTDTEGSDIDGSSGGRSSGSRARGPGRGRGGRGRGRGRGDVAGPSGERGTQIERERKEQNKGARGNHNRREGRAKKVARAGFGPG